MTSYYMFRCSNTTFDECLTKMLFGQSEKMIGFVRNVSPGDILFLHNTTTSEIHGPFVAEARGSLNIDETAWGGNFPSQVKVKSTSSVNKVSVRDANSAGLHFTFMNKFFDFKLSPIAGSTLVKLLSVSF